MKVYIGTGPRYEEITRILHRNLVRRATGRVEVRLMDAWRDPVFSGWHGQPTEENFGRVKGNWVTPFSLFRYAIPALEGGQGYAVYLDADMIVLGDICELWDYAEPGRWITAKGRDGDCVTIMDCSAIVFDVDRLKGGLYGDKHRLRQRVAAVQSPRIPSVWNDTDHYVPGVSKLVHYTGMKTQPWHPYPEAIDYDPHPDESALRLWERERARQRFVEGFLDAQYSRD